MFCPQLLCVSSWALHFSGMIQITVAIVMHEIWSLMWLMVKPLIALRIGARVLNLHRKLTDTPGVGKGLVHGPDVFTGSFDLYQLKRVYYLHIQL